MDKRTKLTQKIKTLTDLIAGGIDNPAPLVGVLVGLHMELEALDEQDEDPLEWEGESQAE